MGGEYQGEVHRDTNKPLGLGILRFENGEFYAGMFMDGDFCGYGLYQSSKEAWVIGTWCDGKRQDRMTYYNCMTQTIQNHIYNNNELVSSEDVVDPKDAWYGSGQLVHLTEADIEAARDVTLAFYKK